MKKIRDGLMRGLLPAALGASFILGSAAYRKAWGASEAAARTEGREQARYREIIRRLARIEKRLDEFLRPAGNGR